MPCVNCGNSTKEKYGGVVGHIVERTDTETKYICLDCTIEMIRECQNDE